MNHLSNRYYVNNKINGKVFGPFLEYSTARKVADKVDSTYGDIIATIERNDKRVKDTYLKRRIMFH